jgi:hypothetical protein
MAILSCPGCSARVRVPDGRSQIKVTCPKCESEWLYPATVEYSDIDFVCSRSGAPFVVRMMRSATNELFKIKSAWLASEGAPATEIMAHRDSEPLAIFDGRSEGSKPSGMLARLVRSLAPPRPRDLPTLPEGGPERRVQEDTGAGVEHPIDEYDFAGLVCPSCGSTSCHGCDQKGHLACSGGVVTERSEIYCVCIRTGKRAALNVAMKTVTNNRATTTPKEATIRSKGGHPAAEQGPAIASDHNAPRLPPSRGRKL